MIVWIFLLVLLKYLTICLAHQNKHNYAPYPVICPENFTYVREAIHLNENESEYIRNRQKKTQISLYQLIDRLNIKDFNAKEFFLSSLKPISIGLAFSGGGYRSFLNGAGAIAAFDDRSLNSTKSGQLGGLLQATSYIGGISGGSWIVMSIVLSDFTPILLLRKEWDLSEPLLEGVLDLKQVGVSREDVQVLSDKFIDDGDDGFYEKLQNTMTKREFLDELIEERDDDTIIKKRELISKPQSVEDWFENFKTFFKDIFKRKDEPSTPSSILENFEFSSNAISLKMIKKLFDFYKNLHVEVRGKKLSGFQISLTDYWGRALSRKIFPKNSRSPNKKFSDVVKLSSFKTFDQPFPIILSNLRSPGVGKSSVNSTIFEFTPFEFGSWDLRTFANLKYLGSHLVNGLPSFHISGKTICFNNYDNAGFLTGTSSSLFNNVFIYIWKLASSSSKDKYHAIKAVLNLFGLTSQQNDVDPRKHPDYAIYSPNPFYRFLPTQGSEVFDKKQLYMVDGGEDGQNIPFQPFLQKQRQLDVIFALDSTSDKDGWPNGAILENTSLRYNNSNHSSSLISINNNNKIVEIDIFPKIPPVETIELKGLNKKPTFFGCYLENYNIRRELELNSSYLTQINEYLPPIVGYYANQFYSYPSNTSTFKLKYSSNEATAIMQNSYNIMTYANSTIDPDYSQCVGCILLKREFDRRERSLSLLNNHSAIPNICKQCYSQYCYN